MIGLELGPTEVEAGLASLSAALGSYAMLLRRNNKTLIYEANHDTLTGLPNRRGLVESLEGNIEKNPGNFAALFLDIDGLKEANDTNGHQAGDRLIKHTADVLLLQKAMHTLEANTRGPVKGRREDTLSRGAFRLSGDEFVLLLPNISEQWQLEKVQKRLIDELAKKNVKASMGGRIHQAGESGMDLIGAVDNLMYKNKRQRKQEKIDSLPPAKRLAHRLGYKLLGYSGIGVR